MKNSINFKKGYQMDVIKHLELFININMPTLPIVLVEYRLSDEDSNNTQIGEDYICKTIDGVVFYVNKISFDMWIQNRYAVRWENSCVIEDCMLHF
jgi:hypothetical protein